MILSFTELRPQHQERPGIKDPITYLLKRVLLEDRDTGAIVLIPMETKKIKHYMPDEQVKFWGILGSYFPGASKDSLSKMVEGATWLDHSFSLKKFTIYFPTVKDNETPDFEFLFKKYRYVPVFSISNPVYSKDRSTCIIYVRGYQEGPFTIEIKKDSNGNWISDVITTDWLV